MLHILVSAAILFVVGAIAIFFVFGSGSSDSLDLDLEIIETYRSIDTTLLGIEEVEIPLQFCDGVLRNIDDQWTCEEAEPEFKIFDAGRGISCIEITRLGQAIDWECVK